MKITSLAVLAFAFSASSQAATISINFTENGSVDSTMLAGDVAGVAGPATRVSNWNNVPGGDNSASNLVYSDGTNSGASVQITGSIGAYHLDHAVTTGDDRMWKGYADFNENPGMLSFTNLNLTGTFDVYVYFDGNNGTDWRNASFTLGATTFTGEDSEGVSWGVGNNSGKVYQLPVAGGTGNAAWPNSPNNSEGNYVVFSGVSGSSFDLEVVGGDHAGTFTRASINGIQIVQVPEPSTLLSGAIGLMLMIRRRR